MIKWITSLNLIQILVLLSAVFAAPAIAQTNETAWFRMGMDYYSQGKFEEALQAYNKSLNLNPLNAEVWNNKGSSLGMQGRYDEAFQAFEKAIEINSSYAEDWYNMGAIYDLKGNYRRAIWAYGEATRINPGYQKAWIAKNAAISVIGAENYFSLVHAGGS